MSSKANDILDDIVTTLQGIADPTFTVEKRLPTREELRNWAQAQLPAIGVVAELPLPQQYKWATGRGPSQDFVQVATLLTFWLHVYALAPETANQEANNLLAKIWAALMADPTRGNRAIRTELYPRDIGWDQPYVFLRIEGRVYYRHGSSTI